MNLLYLLIIKQEIKIFKAVLIAGTPEFRGFRKETKPDFCLSEFTYYTVSTSGFEKLSTELIKPA